MESKKRIAWNLKGRTAVAAIEPSTLHRIMRSHAILSCHHKPLLATIEALITVQYVGGLSGPLQRPELFICLVTRILQITPDPSIVLAMLHQDVHKYLRVAALFVIRFIGNDAMMREALRVGWEDYRKIRVYGYVKDRERAKTDSDNNNKSDDGVVGENNVVCKDKEEEVACMRVPSYGIMCVDEITDCLFGIQKNNDNGNEKVGDCGSGYLWLGIRFPPLLL